MASRSARLAARHTGHTEFVNHSSRVRWMDRQTAMTSSHCRALNANTFKATDNGRTMIRCHTGGVSRSRTNTLQQTTHKTNVGVLKHVNVRSLSQRLRARGSLVPCRTAAPSVGTFLDEQFTIDSTNGKHTSQQQPSQIAEIESSSEVFNWTRAWYPLAAVTALQQDAPTAQQLLGMRLVVWWDKSSSSWKCFEDLCPHRLAPLSEGRIHESGQLQCTYHGWTFNSSGACTSIPQLGDPKAHGTACSSSRSCVRSFPVYVQDGLLWVYADSTGGAGGQPQDKPPAALLLPEGNHIMSPWFQRDVPLSYDILLENFLDPAHVPHSHHGVVGDRDADHTLSMSPQEPLTKDAGFSLNVNSPARGMNNYLLQFSPPCLVRHNFPGATMLLYGIPTSPGHSRVVMTFVGPEGSTQTRPATPQLPAWVNVMLDLIDKVPALQHALNRNAIIDGDTYFLHAAERVLYERGDFTSWRRQYYMPGSSDAAVLAWRKWLDTFGRALPTLPRSAADIPPLMPREQVLDRLKQHTEVCPHCSTALRNATFAAGLMAAVAAVAAGSIVAAVVTGSAQLLSPFNAAAMAVSVAAGLAATALMRFRQFFIFTDYVHAEH